MSRNPSRPEARLPAAPPQWAPPSWKAASSPLPLPPSSTCSPFFLSPQCLLPPPAGLPTQLPVAETGISSYRAKSLQSCPTLRDPVDCSPPGSSVCGILQARILEWVAMPSSRGIFPYPGIEPASLTSPALAGKFFTTRATWEAHHQIGSV